MRRSRGSGDDALSGGEGDDILSGGGGTDRFVFGEVDTGRDRIIDFDQENDVVDLSALFWGKTGDARQYVSVRLDTNYATPVPTLDSTLLVKRPDNSTQEIVLQNVVIGGPQLIRLIVEGRLRMGALSIPETVQLALASGSATPLPESLHQSFTVQLTRSGAGVPAVLDVPLGFFEQTLGGRFVVDGATSGEGQRSVVSLARGETSRTVTIHPLPDLDTAGVGTVQVSVLPHFKYSVSGSAVSQAISDNPKVWLEVTQPNAVATPAQAAKVRLYRDGSLTQSLSVNFQLGGTAVNGVHIQSVPSSVTILAGQSYREIQIAARSAGLASGPKILLLQLASQDRYLLGNPHEGIVYVGNTAAETNSAGFDRWITASTGGVISSLTMLAATVPDKVRNYLQAYALGLNSVEELGRRGIDLRIVAERPVLTTPGRLNAADLRWSIESGTSLSQWTDASSSFVQTAEGSGFKFTGPALSPSEPGKFYRMNFALNPGQSAASSLTALTGTTRYGMSGNINWITGPTPGSLVSSGGASGDTSRMIAQVTGAARLDFEMEIPGANWDDALLFYIDGVLQAESYGEAVRVTQNLSGLATRLLMWEFTKGSGQAVIRNLMR